MPPIHEKILFGFTLLASAASSAAGAALTQGETRWFFVTFAASFLMSGFLALMCKKPEETIQLVVGRCGFAIMGGIFLSKPVVHYTGLIAITTADAIALAGVSSGVCFVMFFIGYAGLRLIETRSPAIAEKWFRKLDP